MKPPTSRKEVPYFIGAENYYRNIWARLSHTLAPLTEITPNTVKFKWTQIKHDDFEEIKRILAHETLLNYPTFTPMLSISN